MQDKRCSDLITSVPRAVPAPPWATSASSSVKSRSVSLFSSRGSRFGCPRWLSWLMVGLLLLSRVRSLPQGRQTSCWLLHHGEQLTQLPLESSTAPPSARSLSSSVRSRSVSLFNSRGSMFGCRLWLSVLMGVSSCPQYPAQVLSPCTRNGAILRDQDLPPARVVIAGCKIPKTPVENSPPVEANGRSFSWRGGEPPVTRWRRARNRATQAPGTVGL